MELTCSVRVLMIGLSLVSGLAIPLPARAQPASRAEASQYLFRQGREKVKGGDCVKAIPLFEASHRAHPSRGALYNLALCEEETGRLTIAWTHLQQLLPMLPEGDERLSDTRRRIAAIEARIARVRVDLAAGAPAGATVTLDGAELQAGRLGVEIPLDPGQHTIVVRAAGREDERRDLTAKAGQQQTLTVEAGAPVARGGAAPARALAPAAPPTPAEPQRRSSLSLAPGLVAGGVGLAGLGVMAVTGILAVGKKGELEHMCPDPTRCESPGPALAREGQALTTASTAAAVIGLVGVGAGATLLVWSSRSSRTARLGPVVWAGGAGAVLEGRF